MACQPRPTLCEGTTTNTAHHLSASTTTSPAPPPDDHRAALATDLVAAVLEAGRVTRRLGEEVNRHTGINRTHYLTLLRVQEHDRSRISDLAAGLAIDISVMSRKIAALDELGLVSRTPHPDDGRAQVVSVTELGRATIAENRRIYTESIGRLTADWSEEDIATLAAGLHRLGRERLADVVVIDDHENDQDSDGGNRR